MIEQRFKKDLITKLKKTFPGIIILFNDPTSNQGFPDLLLLYKNTWAALECKRSQFSSRRPNQDHHISILNKMSYASYIYPENEQEVLDELQKTFGFRKSACIFGRE